MILATSTILADLILDFFDFLRVRGKFNCIDKTPKTTLVSRDVFINVLSTSAESVLYVGKHTDSLKDVDAQFAILYDRQLGVLVTDGSVLLQYNFLMDVAQQQHLVYRKIHEHSNYGIRIGSPRKIIDYFRSVKGMSLGNFLSDIIFNDRMYPTLDNTSLGEDTFKCLFYQKDKKGNVRPIGVGLTDTIGRKWFILDQMFSRRDIRSLLKVAVQRRHVKTVLTMTPQNIISTEVSLTDQPHTLRPFIEALNDTVAAFRKHMETLPDGQIKDHVTDVFSSLCDQKTRLTFYKHDEDPST